MQGFQRGAAGSGLSSEDDISSDSSEEKPSRHHIIAATGAHHARGEEDDDDEEEEAEVEVIEEIEEKEEDVLEVEEEEEEEEEVEDRYRAAPTMVETEETSNNNNNNSNNNNNNNSEYRASRPVARRSKIIMPGQQMIAGVNALSESFKSKQNSSSSKVKRPNPEVFVKYHECMKNHAASLGGHALDGCGEFLPSFSDPLLCSACGCHRNFHRRESNLEPGSEGGYVCNCKKPRTPYNNNMNLNLRSNLHPRGTLIPDDDPSTPISLPLSSSKDIVPLAHVAGSMSSMHYTDDLDIHSGGSSSRKKRYRTKFSTEQKEEMTQFADKLGWKIVKQHEALVTQFCEDVGVPRNVFKVWMHNNKNISAKRSNTGESVLTLKSESPSDY